MGGVNQRRTNAEWTSEHQTERTAQVGFGVCPYDTMDTVSQLELSYGYE
ncbi:hypothetical protein SAMN04489735_102539 [Aneurinibacillus thermoaerophilus]|uniref:Uncharacterized protein n=1 Tax=Aneurinibacillus thermoaerophilus TaxID=143495 RepID=A0A1G8CGH6_ANETH|nr:hypothetical protein SAMN04489735_102539 [Aneurinibacillus thermoaerophilus]